MAWLLTHMWMALAAVGLFSLLLGWSVRGILLVGKLRTARVDRDVAQTELEQARAEIEGLYAAQRNAASGAASSSDPALRAELKSREQRVSELSSELARSKAELQSLKTGGARAAVAAAPAAAASVGAAKLGANVDQEEATLVWRNRHLESRVRYLETALHETAATQQAAPVEAAATPEAVASEPSAEADKQKWQTDMLKQRVEALEAELAAQPARAPAPVDVPAEEDTNEELARLRWRNRFLEGRVAYFEGDGASEDVPEAAEGESDSDEVEAEDVSISEAILSELEEEDAAAEADEDTDEFAEESEDEDVEEAGFQADEEEGASEDEDEPEDAAEIDDEGAFDDEDENYAASELEENTGEEDFAGDIEPDEDEDAAEADEAPEEDLPELNAEKPLSLERPVGGTPDDLTIIGGVGPKIQEVLNELGIYHYDQIAAWTPENIAWVDHHLNFSGRIAREGWVEQAAILSGDVADE